MTHYMKLNPKPFSMIASGYKTIELRLNDEKRQKISIGDTIVFTQINDPSHTLSVTVGNLYNFPTFEQLYKALPLDKCGYSAAELSNANPKDMEEYYTLEMQNKYGVLGIELKLDTI